MIVIGLSGTNGSGKDTVATMLVDRHGFLFVSGSDMLRAEAKKRGQTAGREVLREISSDWRRQFGMGVIIDKAVEVFDAADKKYNGLIIASLRNPGEAERVHELGGKVIWVDADPKVRYRRITENAHKRGRPDEDLKTYEEFLAEEQAEMQHLGDTATLNMSGVKEKSDIFLENNGNDVEAFKDEAEAVLAPLIKNEN